MPAPIQLYPYQKEWFLNRSRFKVGMFARQTGKTFTSTLEIVESSLRAEAQGGRERWVILSRGERQAIEAMEEGVKRHCQAFGAAFEAFDVDWKGGDAIYKVQEVLLPNGSRLTALPSSPDTARGFSAHVFLDEFAFHPDSRKIWSALFPVISAGKRLRVVSTPNGKNNKFYDLMTNEDPVWYRQAVSIHQAVAEGLPRDIEELRCALNDEDAWKQEYELEWLDEASAWLSLEMIIGVEHEWAGTPDRRAGGSCFIGVDIAARQDLFVIWVVEVVGDVLWTREVIVRQRISFAEQDFLLDKAVKSYRAVKIVMDQTGMGEKPVEDAIRRYGATRVEGMVFSPNNKMILATVGKQAFEDRKIRIPMGDHALRDDLHKLKKIPSITGGTPRFQANSDSGGHADRAWACFMAIYAAQSSSVKIDFQSDGHSRPGVGALSVREDIGFGAVSGRSMRGFL